MDRAIIGQFLDRFTGLAAGATTIGLLAIADRSGLLGHLDADGATASEIAGRAQLEPRYVEEIMAGLAAARVVEYDADAATFRMLPEHALFLVDETSPYYLAGWLDMIPALMERLDDVAGAVRVGGGVDSADFGQGVVKAIDRLNSPSQRVFLTTRWLPGLTGLVDRLQDGIRVADIGCGSGTAIVVMASAYPESEFVGFDVSDEALAIARDRARGLANAGFVNAGANDIPISEPFDLITSFDVIHDLPDPLGALERIAQALGAGGSYLMMEPEAGPHLEDDLDIDGALLYGTSTMYCLTQSLAVGGAGLGAAWGPEKARHYAMEAGFTSFEKLEDISNRFSAFYLLEK